MMFRLKDQKERENLSQDKTNGSFYPLAADRTCQEIYQDFLDYKFGGYKETLGIMNIGMGLLMSTSAVNTVMKLSALSVASTLPVGSSMVSALSSALINIAPFALSAYGAYTLADAVLRRWRHSFLLKSAIQVESSVPPMTEGDKNGLFIGYTTDDGRLVGLPDDNLFRHGLISGQSGMGKTVVASFLMQQQMQRGGGVLFIDGKLDASNIQQMYQFAAWCGRAQDFLVLNPGQPFLVLDENGKEVGVHYSDKRTIAKKKYKVVRNSNTYNPILYGDADEVSSRIISLVPTTEGNAGSDFFKQSSNYALTVLIGACQAAGYAYNFSDLAIMMTNEKAMMDLKNTLEAENPTSNEYVNLMLFLEQYKQTNKDGTTSLDMKKMKDVLGGIAGRMNTFGTGGFGEILNTYQPEVKLYDAVVKGKIVYVALPTMGKDIAAQNFGKMMLGDFRTAVSWLQRNIKDRPKIPFMAFFDEAASYVSESWSVVFEQARSAGIFLLPALQTYSGLSNISEDFKERVVVNNVTKIFFRQGSVDSSATDASELIGNTRRVTVTRTSSDGDSASSSFVQVSPQKQQGLSTGEASGEREEEVPLIIPERIRSMRIGECLLSYEGAKVYNLIVPLLSLSKEMEKKIGPFRLNFKQKKPDKSVKGFYFFQRAQDFVT